LHAVVFGILTDAGFPLQWHCRRDQRGVEEVGDRLTEDWCSYTHRNMPESCPDP